MPDVIRAPWTAEEVELLNRFQNLGFVHPFTCPADGEHGSKRHSDHRILVATTEGWRCEWDNCGYRQDWAHAAMLGEWENPFDGLH